MDVLFFLRERTNLIRRYYGQASVPFTEIMRKIEAKEKPYDDPPYSEDGEPAFLEEWLEANTCRELLGRTCVSMLAGSLKLYFHQWEKFLVGRWEPKARKKAFESGLIGGYRLCFQEVAKIDWRECPVDLGILEQVVLLRNRDQHPEHVSLIDGGYWGEAHKRFSNLLFTDEAGKAVTEDEQSMSTVWGPRVTVSRDDLYTAIEQVEVLAAWMEPYLQDARWPRRNTASDAEAS